MCVCASGHDCCVQVLLLFSIKGATALSQAAITGAGLSGVGCLLTRAHPLKPGEPLINFQIALLLAPFLLIGVGIGESPQLSS